MRKQLELDDFVVSDEPAVCIVTASATNSHIKLASSETLNYIKNVQPIPGKTIILVLAMTAGEFYGPNRNGDAWPERPLRVKDTIIPEDAVLPKHYKSFETDAHIFRHHINKDPAKSIGNILKAFYNWKMHRVELLLTLDNEKAEDIIEQINSGKFPAVSMGCKVPYDVCSVCGHKAPSRAQYCDHTKYHMGEFLKNGKRIFVWNPYPKFFDLSIVARPADRLGYMMKKVASVPEITSAERGEEIEQLENKLRQLRKLSLLSKILKGNIVAAKDENAYVRITKKFADDVAVPLTKKIPRFPPQVIKYLCRFSPDVVLSTLGALGIALSTPEFLDYLAARNGLSIPLSEETAARALALQTAIFDFLQDYPEQVDQLSKQLTLSEEKISVDLVTNILPWLDMRSLQHDYLVKRAAWFARETAPLYTDVASGYTPFSSDVYRFQSPVTGETFATTEAAIRRSATAAYDIRRKQLLEQGLPFVAGTALSFIPYFGKFLGAPLLGYSAYNISNILGRDYLKIPTPYGPIRFGTTLPYPPAFAPTEVVKVSFDHAAILKLAQDFAHCPKVFSVSDIDLRTTFGNSLLEKIGSCV